ncbi:hypothetical protein ATY81_17740 [Rhizobium sp. R72]|nr:hypothetical protein ATY81_17740 [Rhizobium sp. R72]OWW04368.1 hypothetical protein ATY80_17740 [Rhizobium sp. R711]
MLCGNDEILEVAALRKDLSGTLSLIETIQEKFPTFVQDGRACLRSTYTYRNRRKLPVTNG